MEKTENGVAVILRFMGFLVFGLGFFAGIFLSYQIGEYSWDREFLPGLMLLYWGISFLSGMVLIGFAEIIQLLTDIKTYSFNIHVNQNIK